MKVFKWILRTIKYLLITVMLIIFLSNFFIMIKSYLNPGEHPTVFGFSSAVVISGSMSPELEVDDVLLLQAQDEYFDGDVIAFNTGRSLVTHRIIKTLPEGFITRGDANNADDDWVVPPDAISGKVIYVVPGLGKALSFMRSPLGLLIIVLIMFGAIMIPDKNNAESPDENENEK